MSAASPDFRAIFESAPGLYLVLTPDLSIVAVSDAYLTATMTKREDILGRGLFDVFPDNPDDPDATGTKNLRASLARVLANRVADAMAEQKYDVRGPDGTFRLKYWSPHNYPVLSASGDVLYILHTVEDVTELVLAREVGRETARQKDAFLDAIVENLPNMVFVKDAETLSFSRFNRAGEELLGLPRSELLGKNDYDFFPAEEAVAFQAKDRETLRGKALVDVPEEPIQTKTGLRWLHTKKVPILDANGTPTHLLGISEDITDRKRAQEDLVRAKEAAEEASRELESFSYSVAHDLRAPLRSIDGFSQALLEDCDELNDEGKKYLGLIRGSAQHMAQLIDALLTLSRVTRSDLHRQQTDLSALAREAIARLASTQPARSVDVVIADGVLGAGDPRLLAVVLDNLLGNAWKFTGKRDHARIEFAVDSSSGSPVYLVRDNGAGFDAAFVHKLFGVFQRLHSTSEFEGTGIGLATIQRIIRRHGGRIWAEGEVDRGATFYFTLPGKS